MSCSVSPCSKPGFAAHFGSFVTGVNEKGKPVDAGGPEEVADTLSLVCDWGEYLSTSDAEKAEFAAHSRTFDTIKKFHAIPSLCKKLTSIRDGLEKRSKTDETTEIDKELFSNSTLLVKSGAETSLFLHQASIVDLKDSVSLAKGVYWSGLGVFDTFNLLVTHPDTIRELQETIDNTKDPELQNLQQHKLYSTYFEVVKSIVLVAMAVISLISLAVVTPLESVIFSGVFFLSLATVWTVINIGNHFYREIIRVEIEDHAKQAAGIV